MRKFCPPSVQERCSMHLAPIEIQRKHDMAVKCIVVGTYVGDSIAGNRNDTGTLNDATHSVADELAVLYAAG